MKNVVIIGSGVIGAAIAHVLSDYDFHITILEKEPDVASKITKANSAIIHSGVDPLPHSLKSTLNIQGVKLYESLSEQLHFSYQKIGGLIVGFDESDKQTIHALFDKASHLGIEAELWDKAKILAHNPDLNPDVSLGLYTKDTAIVSPWEVVYAFLHNALSRGATLHRNTAVNGITKTKNTFKIHTNKGRFYADWVINAAGLDAINITKMVTTPSYTMRYTRGSYYVLEQHHSIGIHQVIYPTPSHKGKGVLFVPTVHHNALIGPTSVLVEDQENVSVTQAELDELRAKANKLLGLSFSDKIIRTFAGMRPKTSLPDFLIHEHPEVSRFIELAGIESPGLAAAPAIGHYVLSLMLKQADVKKRNMPLYTYDFHTFSLSCEERNKKIALDPRYGIIVCRCETISEAEIIASIKGPLGANSIEGVKRRCRPGSGNCQGSFCQAKVLELLSKELQIPLNEVLFECDQSTLLVLSNKGGDQS